MLVSLSRAVAVLALLAACTSGRSVRSESRPDQGATAVPNGSSTAGAAPGRDEPGAEGALPAAFKGYELYAWEQGGALEFTLISGTNREKTLEEIMARTPELEGEWVVAPGQGLPALRATLARVPAGTSVIMAHHAGLPPLSAQNRQAVAALLPR